MIKTDEHKRMMKMLIVDDEPIICEGLRLTIDWAKLGVEVVGEAYDGEEALQMVKEHGVDFLLSDVRMNGMDGLQLTERLKSDFPHVRVVMISGYEDFDYARRAMRLGVTDYLLKPVDIDELKQVVKGIVKGLYKVEVEERMADKDENVLWLSRMLHDNPSYIQITPPQQLRGVEFRVIVSQLTDFSENFEMLLDEDYLQIQQQWVQLIHDQLSLSSIRSLAVFEHRNLLYTLAMSDKKQDDEQWKDLLGKIPDAWRGPSRLYCAVSAEYDRLEQTSKASIEARELLQFYILEQHDILLPGDRSRLEHERSSLTYNYQELVRNLVTALFKQELEAVELLVSELFAMLLRERLLLHEIVKVYDELLVMLHQRLQQSGLAQVKYSRSSEIDLNVHNSYESIEAIVIQDMKHLMQIINQFGHNRSYWIIEKAKIYMTEQYHDDIKASEVADWLKITPSYFSLIFKQSTGKSFKEYMNELRIEHAKQLLATTHDKVFEIADKVGYKEYKYFVSVFKLYTGMTPKEYRSLNVEQQIK